LSFLQSNIEIVVDISANDRGNKQFDPTNVPYRLVKLIARAEEGDTLLFVFFGFGFVRPGRQPNIYLGRDEEEKKIHA
jgi:hypothetical protein